MNISERTSRLLAFARELQRAQTYEDLLVTTKAEIEDAIGYAHVWLFVEDVGEPNHWRVIDVVGQKRALVLRDYAVLPVRGDAMLEELSRSDVPVVVADARTDPRTNKALVEALGNRTIVNVPLRLIDKPFGGFGTGTFGDEGVRPPTAEQVEYLAAMSTELSVAAARIRLQEERVRSEVLLRIREEELAATLYSIGDAVLTTDAEGLVTRMNPTAEKLTGFSSAEATGKELGTIFRIVDETTRSPVESPARRVIREGTVIGLANHTLLIARDGTERPIADSGAPIRDPDGTLHGVVLVFRDQTAQRTALRTAREATRRLQVLADTSREFAVATADWSRLIDIVARRLTEVIGDGCIVHLVSDAHALEAASIHHRDETTQTFLRETVGTQRQLVGDGLVGKVAQTGRAVFLPTVSKEQLAAQATPRWHPLIDRLEVTTVLGLPLTSRGELLGVLTLARGGGKPYSEDDQRFAQDLADRAALAIDNGRLLTELEARVSARTAAVEEVNRELESFSYSVAHDLRAPLRRMNGFSTALLEDYGEGLDGDARDYLNRIVSGAKEMGKMIDALLELSRVSRAPVRGEIVDLGELAAAAIEQLRAADPTRVVETSIAPGLGAVGDPQLLRSLVENLVRNAWKYTSKNASARIAIGRALVENTSAFFVKDNGAGFDMAQAKKLFVPFGRLHSNDEFEGSGIGLATVQRIVRRHGGRIWAEGVVGEGATFWFSLSSSMPIAGSGEHRLRLPPPALPVE